MGRKKRIPLIQFIKFNIVGIINTAITYGIYSLLVYLGVHHQIAVLCDYTFGIMISFFFNKHMTFKIKERTSPGMLFRMILSYVFILGVNMAALWVLVDTLLFNKYLSQIAALALVSVLSFTAQKFFVFRISLKREQPCPTK
jgi:putative flippase GtrA